MRKILYIRPCTTVDEMEHIKYGRPYYILPLGILSIVSYCIKEVPNVEYKILDFCTTNRVEVTRKEMYDEIIEVVSEYEPDIVGISVLSSVLANHIEPIAEIIKYNYPEICIIAGGVGASVLTKEEIAATLYHIDAISYSEGEIPTAQLLRADNLQKELEVNPSFITRNNARNVSFKPQAQVLENLDAIPILPLHLIQIENYENAVLDLEGRKSIALHTVRGCPFACHFCAAPGLSGRKLRGMSADRVIADLETYVDKYGYNQVMILDEQLLFRQDRAKEILEKLYEMDLVVSIPNGINIKLVNDDILPIIKKVKFDRYVFALESGSQRVLEKLMNKPVTLEDAREKLEKIYDEEVETHSNFILGMPGETQEERRETAEFIKSVALDWSVIFVALPIRGSALQKECEEKGWLEEVEGSYRIKNKDINPDELEQEAYLMNLECNFVHNYAMRTGRYNKAKKRFDFIRKKYPEQAFAHYFFAQCCRELKEENLYQEGMEEYFAILKKDKRWKEYACHFLLPIEENVGDIE